MYYAPTDIQDMELDCVAAAGKSIPNCTIEHDQPNSPESKLIFCDPTATGCQFNPGIGQLRNHQNDSNGYWPYYEMQVTNANPITFVTKENLKNLPQFWISAGYNDTLVPYKQSVRMANALKNIGQNESLYVVDFCSCPNSAQYPTGCGHGTQPEQCWAPIDQSVEKWLSQWKQ